MKKVSKTNSQLVAVCMFCAVTKTVTYHNFTKCYSKK